jgi:hydroxyacyl-ACP dehydratase HTD2-like protein with hotdog domain
MSYEEYVGREETREDRADPRLAGGMAATLGRPLAGDEWPALWHWTLFQDWKMPGELGTDGHPRRGGFLPPVHDLPRRMWAGGRVTFHAPVRTGDAVRRVSTIRSVKEKAGGSGRLVFVTVQHMLHGPAGLLVEEEQDIVYRGTEGAAVKPAPAAPAWEDASEASLVPDSVMLFRYSALTGNGHRIHYDHPYVTQEEGYPGLVVHGPLQATLLARHALDVALGQGAGQGARIARFAYRGKRPCFDGRRLTLLGRRAADGTIQLETRDETGATCQEAEAILVWK